MDRIKRSKATVALVIFSLLMIIGMIGIYYWEPGETSVVAPKRGTIGIIDVQGAIEDPEYTEVLLKSIKEAVEDSKIKAVVLQIDSPGGTVDHIEQIYYDLLVLKEEKPIVASTTMALSGGYYLAASADYIFTLPSSFVGNIGVMGVGPSFLLPSQFTFETGPHKITGFSPLLFPYNVTKALDSFLEAVRDGRGTRLKIDEIDLRSGSIWLGKEALGKGLVDEIGSQQNAVSYAADLAGLETYTSENLLDRIVQESEGISSMYPTINEIREIHPPPSLHYLYMPGDIYMQSEIETPETELDEVNETTTRIGHVIVDLSHGNLVSPFVLDYLEAELAKRAVYVGYSSNWTLIEGALDFASCLVITAPTERYTYEEFEAIDKFVSEGNMLVLFSDASSEFLQASTLQGPINSISNRFGLHFGKGYLYNMVKNWGNYRNIHLTQFEENWLTEDVQELVFFTTTHISPTDSNAAYASYGTHNSISEEIDIYTAVALLDKGNTTIAAFGDVTWLMEPWIRVSDNQKLADNLINKIAEISQVD
jgi:ClpP class serine protease